MKNINVDLQKATLIASGSGIFFSSVGSMLGAPARLEWVLAIIGVFVGIFLVIKAPPKSNNTPADDRFGTAKIYNRGEYIEVKLDDPPIEARADNLAEAFQVLSGKVDEFGRGASEALLTELRHMNED